MLLFVSIRRVLFIAAMLLPLSVEAQEALWHPGSGSPPIINIGLNEYDGHVTNTDIVQDDRGLIYVANGWGILEYDGSTWRTITIDEAGYPSALAAGPHGVLYVGGDYFFGILETNEVGEWHFLPLHTTISGGLPEFGRIFQAHQTDSGAVFRGREHIFTWNGQAVNVIEAEKPLQASFVLRENVYVAHAGGGLSRLHDEVLQPLTGFVFDEKQVIGLMPHGVEGAFVFTTDGVFRCALAYARSCTQISLEAWEQVQGSKPQSVIQLHSGTVAVATLQAGIMLVNLEHDLLRVIDRRQGLRSNTAYRMMIDRERGLWLALVDGLARIEVEAPYSVINEHHRLENILVTDMAQAGETLFMATNQGVAFLHRRAPANRIRVFHVPGSDALCLSITSVQDGVLSGCVDGVYFVSDPAGTQDPRAMVGTPLLSGAIDVEVVSVSSFDSSRVYVVGEQGMGILQRVNTAWEWSGWYEGITNDIRGIHEVSSDTLWLGTRLSGIIQVVLDEAGGIATVDKYGTETGIPSARTVPFDIDGRPKIGAGGGASGLYKMESHDGVVAFVPDTTWSQAFLDSETEIIRVAKDHRGHFWNGGNARLSELIPRGDGSYQWDETPYLQRRMAPEKLFTMHVAPDGALWTSWIGQMVRYLPSPETVVPASYPVFVRRLVVGDSTLYNGSPSLSEAFPEFVNTRDAMRLEFAAPRYTASNKILYRTRLKGFDDTWSSWRLESFRDYTNIPAGTYTFEVQARDVHGFESEVGMYRFRISPPWFLSAWALSLGVILGGCCVVGIAVGYNRMQIHRLKAQNAKLEQGVSDRTQEVLKQKKEIEFANEELQRRNRELIIANSSLEERTKQLNDALETNKEILGVTAHDLKNPLGGIISLAGLLINQAEADSETVTENVRELAPLVKEEAERMLGVVSALLDRHRDDVVVLNKSWCSLPDLVASVLRYNTYLARRKYIELQYDRNEVERVEADKHAIQNVLDNLISNAIKFSPPKTKVRVLVWQEVVSIEPNKHPFSSYVCVSVSDEGPGLSAEDKDLVFGKMMRLSAKPTGGEHTTGLGLYISKKIIQAHKGLIGVDSTPGKGAEFWFKIPITPSTPAAVAREELAHEPRTTED